MHLRTSGLAVGGGDPTLLRRLVDGTQEIGRSDGHPVDQECRRARQLTLLGLLYVRLNPGIRAAAVQTGVELLGIETQRTGKLLQIGFGERPPVLALLMLKEVVVVGPELTLIRRTFRGFGGPERLLADDDEMLEYVLSLAGSDERR
ncbi:MAG: hypothetical protein JWN15_1644 [Firmicutes bacterium]|nr:hypothetical protein [Bacillota bacterium]